VKNGDLGWVDGRGCVIHFQVAGCQINKEKLAMILTLWETSTIMFACFSSSCAMYFDAITRETNSLAPEQAAEHRMSSPIMADHGLNVAFFDFASLLTDGHVRPSSHVQHLVGVSVGKVMGAESARLHREGFSLAQPINAMRHSKLRANCCYLFLIQYCRGASRAV
jgi:hypothetical protein